MSINGLKALAIMVSALAACQLMGCQALDTVKVEDRKTHEVSASVVVRPDELHFHRGGTGGIEFGYERHFGQGRQFIEEGHYVSLDNRQIAGPQVVRNEADVQHGHIAYNQLLVFGKHFELEPALGLAYDQIALTSHITTAGSSIDFDQHNWGVSIGITPRLNFNRYLGFEARLRFGVGNDGSVSQNENLAFLLRPTEHIAITAGYLFYSHEFETPHYTSNVDISFQGPSAALRLAF